MKALALENKKKIKVAKFIWWIPHYRVPVFRRLCQNECLNFTIYAGDNTQVVGGTKVASASEVGKIEGVNWSRLKSRRLKGPLFKDYEWQPGAVEVAMKHDLDAAICLGNKSLSNWLVRVILKMRGIPLIEWTQGVRVSESGFKWAMRKFYMKWAKAHLLYGNFARNFYISHGFKKESVFVVYNSLDYDKQVEIRKKNSNEDICQIRKRFGVSKREDRLVFHSGRLEKRKNLSILIDAIGKFKEQNQKVVLVLVGDGDERQSLKRQVDKAGLNDYIVFYGACYDEEVLGCIIQASDLCVVPGALGLLAMHSFVYGTPILVCDNNQGLHGPEIETVIEGKTGRFFCEGSLNDLVDKMKIMLYTEPCKSKMTSACMELIDTYYNPKYQEKVIIEALNSVLPLDKQIPEPD